MVQEVKKNTFTVGLTGGIGSGKSTVAKILKEENIPVFDLDQIGRELCEKDATCIDEILKITNHLAETKEKKIDRIQLKHLFFSDTTIKKKVEDFLQPKIWEDFLKKQAFSFQNGKKLIICEAALLYEKNLDKKMDQMVLVIASKEKRIERIKMRDQASPEFIEKILKEQKNWDINCQVIKPHPIFIENNSSIDHLQEEVQNKLILPWKKMNLL